MLKKDDLVVVIDDGESYSNENTLVQALAEQNNVKTEDIYKWTDNCPNGGTNGEEATVIDIMETLGEGDIVLIKYDNGKYHGISSDGLKLK
jgi:hypothetical protein